MLRRILCMPRVVALNRWLPPGDTTQTLSKAAVRLAHDRVGVVQFVLINYPAVGKVYVDNVDVKLKDRFLFLTASLLLITTIVRLRLYE